MADTYKSCFKDDISVYMEVRFHELSKGRQSECCGIHCLSDSRANNLNVYRYLEHILTELPKLTDEKGNIDTSKLDHLLPWSDELPAQCHKPRR